VNIYNFLVLYKFLYFCPIRRKSINLFQYVLSHTDSNYSNKIDYFNKIYANVVVRKICDFSASFVIDV